MKISKKNMYNIITLIFAIFAVSLLFIINKTDSHKPVEIDNSIKSIFSIGVSSSEIKDAFGYASSSGFSEKGHQIKMVNVLAMIGVEADMRAIMNSRSKCGARAHQAMKVDSADGVSYFVTYDCDDKCSGAKEFKENGVVTTSEAVSLESEFCSKLWGGEVKIIDIHGL